MNHARFSVPRYLVKMKQNVCKREIKWETQLSDLFLANDCLQISWKSTIVHSFIMHSDSLLVVYLLTLYTLHKVSCSRLWTSQKLLTQSTSLYFQTDSLLMCLFHHCGTRFILPQRSLKHMMPSVCVLSHDFLNYPQMRL